MLNINLYSTPHVRRCRFNPILKVALAVTLSWQDSKFYLERQVECGGLVNFFNRGWIFEHNISHTCVEIDHEKISTAILLPSAEPLRELLSITSESMCTVLVNRLFKFAQEKSVVRWTDRPDMTIAVGLGTNKQNMKEIFETNLPPPPP